VKPMTAFAPSRRSGIGTSHQCRACGALLMRQRRENRAA
jgi:hypothetical protein